MRLRRDQNGKGIITAAFGHAGGIMGGTNEAGVSQSTAYLLGASLQSGLLEDIFDVEDKHELQATYRDIYFHDAICGSAVDIQATMPWSDFTLTGADDEKLEIFRKTLEKLNMKSTHELMAKDRLVSGAFVGSLVFDKSPDGVKGFSDMVTFNYADCEILPVPMNSQDPILNLTISEELRNFASADISALQAVRDRMPKDMLENFADSKEVVLEPLSTVYLPRTTLSTVQSGVSYYRRVLPCYLLERVLYRGTITEATKRQRSLQHITVGDTEDWIPTEEDMNFIVQLFQVAETDPLSHIVATRGNIQVSEVMPRSDIWSWNEVSDQVREIKMQALGISDSFLTPDGAFDTTQTALSVFIESMRSFRDHFTQKFYYEKLFPLIARMNDLQTEKKNKETAAPKKEARRLTEIQNELNDTENMLIPELQWHKQLRPSGDQEYMDRLNVLQEKGLPIPLSVWCAAAGVNLEQIMGDLDEDQKIRQELEKYKPKQPEGEEDQYASLQNNAPLSTTGSKKRDTSLLGNIMDRQYTDADMEIASRTRTGKKKWLPKQNEARKRMNGKIVKALESMKDPNEYAKALKRNKR